MAPFYFTYRMSEAMPYQNSCAQGDQSKLKSVVHLQGALLRARPLRRLVIRPSTALWRMWLLWLPLWNSKRRCMRLIWRFAPLCWWYCYCCSWHLRRFRRLVGLWRQVQHSCLKCLGHTGGPFLGEEGFRGTRRFALHAAVFPAPKEPRVEGSWLGEMPTFGLSRRAHFAVRQFVTPTERTGMQAKRYYRLALQTRSSSSAI